MIPAGQLLKFSGPTGHALQNLDKGEIYCQHYSAYNDPFEFWTKITSGIPNAHEEPARYLAALRAWGFDYSTVDEALADTIIRDSVDEYFEECELYAPPFEAMRQGMRISCFGSDGNNLLMWSHYGDGLRGFCVKFDEDALIGGRTDCYVLDVAYRDVPPAVDSLVYGVAWDQDWYSQVAIEETERAVRYQGRSERQGEIAMYEESGAEAIRLMREIWQHVFATKPAEWKYERERRLLVQTAATDIAPVLRKYDRNAVREIIVGERMPDDFRTRLLAIVRKHYAHADVKTARRTNGAYTLTIE